MKDLTLQIKNALKSTNPKEIKGNLKKIKELNSPGLYFQIFKNKSNLDVYDANGYSTSEHQRPKIMIRSNSVSIKPGKAKNGVDRIINYAHHMNIPDACSVGANPNPNHSKEVIEYKGKSWYNSNATVLINNLEFYGWIQLETDTEASELEKIWNNSIETILSGKFERSTFGQGKGSMSENLTNVNYNIEKLIFEINKTSSPAIKKINGMIKQIKKGIV